MKLITQASSALIFVTLVSAQVESFGSLPDCAKPCAANLPANCRFDVKCICADAGFISGISCCVAQTCSPADVQRTLEVATQLCDTVNVQLPSAVPSSCGASSSTTATSGAGIATSSAAAGNQTMSGNATVSATGASNSTGTLGTASLTGSTSAGPTQSSSGATEQNVGSRIGAVGAAIAALALF
ncbi:MAG: hypothetical protein Q9163_005516 [Psora crenata]